MGDCHGVSSMYVVQDGCAVAHPMGAGDFLVVQSDVPRVCPPANKQVAGNFMLFLFYGTDSTEGGGQGDGLWDLVHLSTPWKQLQGGDRGMEVVCQKGDGTSVSIFNGRLWQPKGGARGVGRTGLHLFVGQHLVALKGNARTQKRSRQVVLFLGLLCEG